MNVSKIKKHLVSIIDDMPESKLEALLDFASYLKERSRAEDYWAMQTASKAYQEWLGSDNDVYDQVFQDQLDIRILSFRGSAATEE